MKVLWIEIYLFIELSTRYFKPSSECRLFTDVHYVF